MDWLIQSVKSTFFSSTDKVWKRMVCFYFNQQGLETEGLVLNFLHSRSVLSLNPHSCHMIQWYKASNPSCDRDRDRIDSNVYFGLHIVLHIIIMVALFYVVSLKYYMYLPLYYHVDVFILWARQPKHESFSSTSGLVDVQVK